jgi:raffinose/stachyose/melibiose transport system permease protein
MAITSQFVLILGTLVVAYPILFLVFTSLKDNVAFFTNTFGLPMNPQWHNYPHAWTRGFLNVYFFNSVIATVFSVVLVVMLSTLGGYALGKMHLPKSELIILSFMTFSFIPGIAIYITLYKIVSSVGLTRNHLALILPYAAWGIPVSMYILKKFFETVPMDIVESARMDGCGELRTFVQVVLPLVKPAVASVVVLNFIYNWAEFMWAQIVTAASLSIKTLPIGLLSFRLEMGVEWGPYSAGLVMVTIPLVVVFSFFQRYFIAGLTRGAVKG